MSLKFILIKMKNLKKDLKIKEVLEYTNRTYQIKIKMID
jgi:hypothetical protein